MKVLIPVLALLLGGLVVFSVYNQPPPKNDPAPTPAVQTEGNAGEQSETVANNGTDAPDASADDAAVAPDAIAAGDADANGDAGDTPDADATQADAPAADGQLNLAGLRVRKVESSASTALGTTEPDSTDKLHVAITPWGAGISLIETADYRKELDRDSPPYAVQSTLESYDASGNVVARIHPFSARAAIINGLTVDLVNVQWEHLGAGEYRAIVVNELDEPSINVVRRYELDTGDHGYDVTCHQHVVNHTAAPLKVRFEQYAQGDLPESQAYIGNQRKVIPGYLHPRYDRSRTRVYASEGTVTRVDLLGGSPVWNKAEIEGDRGSGLATLECENR